MLPDVEVRPHHRRRAYFFAHLTKRLPADAVAWADSGVDHDLQFHELARMAKLIAFAEQRARRGERVACVEYLRTHASEWADSGGDWALHSAAERIGAGEHVGGSNG